jgi:hypothetical protein
MLSLVEKVKTMPRQVGERETTNTGSQLSWHAQRRLADLTPKCVGKGFGFNHKIMIIRFRSRHLVLWSLENLMVCESLGKGLVVQGEDVSRPA